MLHQQSSNCMHDSITITMKTNKISLYKWLTPVWITLIMVGIFLSYLTYIIVVEFNEFELIDILLWLFALILWGCLLSTWIIFWKWCSYITFGQDEIVSFHIPGKLLCCCCSLLLSMNCSNSLSANCSKCCPIMLGQAAGA